MKRIGLLGGMSWESSAEYYRLINQEVQKRLGGLHSADCLLRSVDFAEIEELQRLGAWEDAASCLITEALRLVNGGAELLVLCTNTMHKLADAITENIDIPFVHIADATAHAVHQRKLKKVGLLATKYTMEQEFYVGRMKNLHGLNVIVPEESERNTVHDIIYQELCKGEKNNHSRNKYKRIVNNLVIRGVEGIILGCTEIGLLISQNDLPVPVFDTTVLHAKRAVDLALDSG